MKRVLLTIIMCLIILTLGIGVTNAEDRLTALISVDKTEVCKGENLIVTLSLKDYLAEDGGTSAITGRFQYDKNIFEIVRMENWKGQNGWNIGAFNEEEGYYFSALNTTSISVEHDVFKVELKVREDAQVGSTTVSFLDLNPANMNVDFVTNDAAITIDINEKVNNVLIISIVIIGVCFISTIIILCVKKIKGKNNF